MINSQLLKIVPIACLLLLPLSAQAKPSIKTGFTDQAFYQGEESDRNVALDRTKEVKGSVVRLQIEWNQIEPIKPPDAATASDPSWSGFKWSQTDAMIRDITEARLQPLISFLIAPAWAEGANRPPVSANAPSGSWRPSITAYRRFALAAAKRYSGSFPDPEKPGSTLPRVKYWQAWNEPNLTNFLSPQWSKHGSSYTPASPSFYRKLLNTFYSAVKNVHHSNFVVSAGTAPFGDLHRGERRMPPVVFTKEFLCLGGTKKLKPRSCPAPAHFDALAHHPYPVGPPTRRAINVNDVVVPDLGKLTTLLDASVRYGTVYPKRNKQLWATEISWDTNPPDPNGIRSQTQARYIEGALYRLWLQGVDVVTWYLLRDSPKGIGYGYTLQSGVYTHGKTTADDKAKPAYAAFRFPFTAYLKAGKARIWGLAPRSGVVRIEQFNGSKWSAIKYLRAGRNRLFVGWLEAAKGTLLRARIGKEKSLSWRTH